MLSMTTVVIVPFIARSISSIAVALHISFCLNSPTVLPAQAIVSPDFSCIQKSIPAA